jgi:hypothetical protein
MSLFSKPVASIYIKEVRQRLDPDIVPVFTPDTAIEVGDFGSFEDGRFVRKGNLQVDRQVDLEVIEDAVSPFNFASAGKVSMGSSVSVPGPTGQNVLRAQISFTKNKAVVASFQSGTQRSVSDADAFGERLTTMWRRRELRPDRVVVWSVRKAPGGTVIVSEDGDNIVEVFADTALLGPAGITLPSLSAGVTFGSQRKATFTMTADQAAFVVWARIFRLDEAFLAAVDAFGFEEASTQHGSELKPVSFTPDDLLKLL